MNIHKLQVIFSIKYDVFMCSEFALNVGICLGGSINFNLCCSLVGEYKNELNCCLCCVWSNFIH